MTAEPRIVTPQEAQEIEGSIGADGLLDYWTGRRLAHTVTTEPERTRAAVLDEVERLHNAVAGTTDSAQGILYDRLIALRNGAPL